MVGRPEKIMKRIIGALEIDGHKTERKISNFIREKVREASADGVVIGLSGGIDSAVVATLSVGALGKKKVLGLALPDIGVTPKEDMEDARILANGLGIKFKQINIAPILRNYGKSFAASSASQLATANLKPRTRMIILYYHANSLNRLVAGTGNLSELRAGYFTKYGDGGVDILPIGGIYKTQVRRLAQHLKVHHRIIQKVPSAGLWKGQTDEAELGITYERLDMIYRGLDLGFKAGEIADALGVRAGTVRGFIEREKKISHKLKMPEIPKI